MLKDCSPEHHDDRYGWRELVVDVAVCAIIGAGLAILTTIAVIAIKVL